MKKEEQKKDDVTEELEAAALAGITPSVPTIAKATNEGKKAKVEPAGMDVEGEGEVSFPDSVVDFFRGGLGQPPGGFPPALRG